MSNIHYLGGKQYADGKPEEVFKHVLDNKHDHVVVVAWNRDGTNSATYGTTSDIPMVCFQLDLAKLEMLTFANSPAID